MKVSDSNERQPASERIDERIAELGDWRGETLSRMRKLIKEADPDVVEEVKWVTATSRALPTWSHDGIICTGEPYKSVVKLTFAKGATFRTRPSSSTRASRGTQGARSTSMRGRSSTRPRSRRSSVPRSPSMHPAESPRQSERSRARMHLIDQRASGASLTGSSVGHRVGGPIRAVGALGLGALALGAFAIGAVAIGRMAIGRARIRHLEIDELTVRSLRITERVDGPSNANSGSP